MPPTTGDSEMRWHLLAWLTICLLFGGLLIAADGKPAFTNPAEAGPDFPFQGEYLSPDVPPGRPVTAMQVIALGDGKFDLVLYSRGLPGAGWKPGDKAIPGTAELNDK